MEWKVKMLEKGRVTIRLVTPRLEEILWRELKEFWRESNLS